MRLRAETGGDIGVFEDLQTLVVVVAGIAILLVSTMLNLSAFGSAERDQELYDEAESIIDQIESWERLRAVNHYGSPYPEFMLRQPELVTLRHYGGFEDQVRSDLNYNVTFDDLAIPDVNETGAPLAGSKFEFGAPLREGVETVEARVQYVLVLEVRKVDASYDVSERHPCLLRVVVWR